MKLPVHRFNPSIPRSLILYAHLTSRVLKFSSFNLLKSCSPSRAVFKTLLQVCVSNFLATAEGWHIAIASRLKSLIVIKCQILLKEFRVLILLVISAKVGMCRVKGHTAAVFLVVRMLSARV